MVRYEAWLLALVTSSLVATTALAASPATEERTLRAACKAKGGTISTAGLAARPHCVLPTRDAGKPCTSSSQCEVACIATKPAIAGTPIGRCQETTEPFGCRALVEDGKVQPVICVD